MEHTIVRISTGFLRGTIKEALNGKPFHSFQGIPFAQPPLGALRFKAPVPAKSWEGIRDAFSQASPHYGRELQPTITASGKMEFPILGCEDSLYLNVFTPALPHDQYELRPVIVFIHGGAYEGGGTQRYGPEVLLTEDVVLVTTSYRFGALGFLSLDDPELGVTGNAGMKDLVLALKWIQQNIKVFNGDPNNVTIYGESAGASSVHYLILSPTAKGLFHKAIMGSGAAFCYWALGQSDNGVKLAERLGCIGTTKEDILTFLQNLSPDEILKEQLNLTERAPSAPNLFAPVVENPCAPDAFLTENPIDLIVSGKYNHVPMIFGFNSDEGAIFSFAEVNPVAEENIVPSILKLKRGGEEHTAIAKKLRTFYLRDEPERTERGLLTENGKKLVSFTTFLRPVLQSTRLHSKNCEESVYLYRLSVSTKLGYLSKGKSKGVWHADDLGYFFHVPNAPKVQPGSLEDITRKRFVTLFINFVKTGNPNPRKISDLIPIKWEPVKNGEMKLLDIGKNLAMKIDPEEDSMLMWDEIFQSYDHSKHY
ncbi:hypothetical protein HHI36_013796 [Cryptolaemus montrouzieri]|uniref:Carboxylesterase type B domain-containing protein n=1 Tax=Cryptolaemus montrouzieri TaxID=559131 RepID=A0ABD2NJ63_9CUCU